MCGSPVFFLECLFATQSAYAIGPLQSLLLHVLLYEGFAGTVLHAVYHHALLDVVHRVNDPVGVIDKRAVGKAKFVGLRND